MKPHALERAKIAHQIDYVVKANWKLVFENNRECYHCPPNHKEYNTAAYDVQRDMAMLDPSAAAGRWTPSWRAPTPASARSASTRATRCRP